MIQTLDQTRMGWRIPWHSTRVGLIPQPRRCFGVMDQRSKLQLKDRPIPVELITMVREVTSSPVKKVHARPRAASGWCTCQVERMLKMGNSGTCVVGESRGGYGHGKLRPEHGQGGEMGRADLGWLIQGEITGVDQKTGWFGIPMVCGLLAHDLSLSAVGSK